jgi:hypothetical protein
MEEIGEKAKISFLHFLHSLLLQRSTSSQENQPKIVAVIY